MTRRVLRLSRRVLLCGAVLSATVAATIAPSWANADAAANAAADAAADAAARKWFPYVEMLGNFADDGNLGQVDLFVPLLQGPNDLSYFNLRGHTQMDEESEFNVGFGYRHRFDNLIFGAFGHYDQRKDEYDTIYKQGTAGLEVLGRNCDLRINGYLPEDRSSLANHASVVFTTNPDGSTGLKVAVTEREALPGFDGEIGFRLPFGGNWSEDEFTDAADTAGAAEGGGLFDDIRVFAGGYNFIAEEGFDSVTGYRVRMEWGIDDLPGMNSGARLTLGGEYQYDDTRGARSSGTVKLRIPLGLGRSEEAQTLAMMDSLDSRMDIPVVRDRDIVLGDGDTFEVDARSPPAELDGSGAKIYDRYVEVSNRADLDGLTDDEVLFINMLGGEDDATNWFMDNFATHGKGYTYALAGQEAPIWYDNPFSGNRDRTSFIPGGSTPSLQFAVPTRKVDNMFDLLPSDHINGWHVDGLDYNTYNDNGGFTTGYRNMLYLKTDGIRYMTNSSARNMGFHGVRVDGNNSTNPVLYIWDSTFADNKINGVFAFKGATVWADNVRAINNVGKGFSARSNKSLDDTSTHETTMYVSNSIASGNGSSGFSAFEKDAIMYVSNSIASDNDVHGFYAQYGGTMYVSDSSASGNVGTGIRSHGLGSTLYARDSTSSGSREWNGLNASFGGHMFATGMNVYDNARTGASVEGFVHEDSSYFTENFNPKDGTRQELLSSYLYLTDSNIFNNSTGASVDAHGVDEAKIDEFVGSDYTAPTLIMERVRIYDNDHHGVNIFGGRVHLSDSEIFNNGFQPYDDGQFGYDGSTGWAGIQVVSRSGPEADYYTPTAVVTIDNVNIYGNAGSAIRNHGGQVNVTNSNLSGGIGNGSVVEHLIGWDPINSACIRNGGTLSVDGDDIDPETVVPIDFSQHGCNALPEANVNNNSTFPFPTYPAFLSFP